MAEQIDAHLTFMWSSGLIRPPHEFAGESNDKFAETLWNTGDWTWPSVLTGYSLGGKIDSKWEQEQSEHPQDDNFQARPTMDEVSIEKAFDMSSPSLYEAMCKVSIFDRVRIYHRRVGGPKDSGYHITLLIVQMRLVVVSGIKWEATETGAIKETLSLTHHGLDLLYVPQHAKGDQDTPNEAFASWPMPSTKSSMDAPSGDPPNGSPAWDFFNTPTPDDTKDKDDKAFNEKLQKALKEQNKHRGTTTGTTRK